MKDFEWTDAEGTKHNYVAALAVDAKGNVEGAMIVDTLKDRTWLLPSLQNFDVPSWAEKMKSFLLAVKAFAR